MMHRTPEPRGRRKRPPQAVPDAAAQSPAGVSGCSTGLCQWRAFQSPTAVRAAGSPMQRNFAARVAGLQSPASGSGDKARAPIDVYDFSPIKTPQELDVLLTRVKEKMGQQSVKRKKQASSSDNGSDSDAAKPPAKKPPPPHSAKGGAKKAAKKESGSSSSSDDEATDAAKATPQKKAPAGKKPAAAVTPKAGGKQKKNVESSDDDLSEEEYAGKKAGKAVGSGKENVVAVTSGVADSSSDESKKAVANGAPVKDCAKNSKSEPFRRVTTPKSSLDPQFQDNSYAAKVRQRALRVTASAT